MRLAPIAVCLLVPCIVAGWQEPARKRVAIFDFDSSSVRTGYSSPFFQMSSPNVGKAVADLLITRLVQDGAVSVIEREALDRLLSEQNLSNSDRTDARTAAKLGRVLGVDGIILGSITQYVYEDKVTGGGGFMRRSSTFKHDIRARVEVSARLVSPDTAEVLAVAQGLGEMLRKGVKVDMADNSGLMMMTDASKSPIMAESLNKAVAQLATDLKQWFPKLPPRTMEIEGVVADASESGRLVLNVGSFDGLKEGDRLRVWRPGKEIRDPTTGKLLMRDDTLLGEALVTSVKESFAIASYSGADKVKVGDIVKTAGKNQ